MNNESIDCAKETPAADKAIWTAPMLELLGDHRAIQQHIPAQVSDGIFSS